MANSIININGNLIAVYSPDTDPTEGRQSWLHPDARISVFDRSYLYGDSLYEVARTYGGRFFLLEEHLERLEASARLCHMELSQNRATLLGEIEKTWRAFKALPENSTVHPNREAYLRIVLSRGSGKIGFAKECVKSPTTFTLYMQPVEEPTAEQRQKGMHLWVAARLRNDPRALDPAMKSGNYLNSLLAYLEAQDASNSAAPTGPYDDALLCNADGHITEGTTFNIFYVRRGIVVTPPLDIGILDGITRRKVIELARQHSYPVREVRFPKERLYEADEVFLTSSVREVFAVTALDGRKISRGKPGPITRHLEALYQAQRNPS